MAADLFYFISSLPALSQGEKPSCTYQDFIARCSENFGDDIAKRLKALQLLPLKPVHNSSEVAVAWYEFEAFLRNTVAEIRKARLRGSQLNFTKRETPHLSPGDAKHIEDIMAMQSPLDRENALDVFRFHFLEELEAEHFFDIPALEIYAIKLLILEKQFSRQIERGSEEFTKLMEAGLQAARNVRTELEK